MTTIVDATLTIICEACKRCGRYSVARLIDEHGDAKLPDLLQDARRLPESTLRERLRPL
jgi:hypothetical protein